MKTFDEWWVETEPNIFRNTNLDESTVSLARAAAALAWDAAKWEELKDDIRKLKEVSTNG